MAGGEAIRVSAFDDNKCRFLTVSGWRNSGPDHWQTLWESELPNCSRVRQDVWEDPFPQHWTQAVDEAVRACKRPVILIAHSLGAVPRVVRGVAEVWPQVPRAVWAQNSTGPHP